MQLKKFSGLPATEVVTGRTATTRSGTRRMMATAGEMSGEKQPPAKDIDDSSDDDSGEVKPTKNLRTQSRKRTRDSGRGAEKKKKQKTERKQKKSFRSTLVGFQQMVGLLPLTKEHLVELRKTPFWFTIEPFVNKRVRFIKKYDELTLELLKRFELRTRTIAVGPTRMEVTPKDISLIFGIICGTKEMKLGYHGKVDSPMVRRLCACYMADTN